MILGISGNKGSGKSTLGEALKRKHRYQILTFAGPLKEALIHTFNLNPEVLEDQSLKNEVFERKRVTESQINNFIDYLNENFIPISDETKKEVLLKHTNCSYESYRELMQYFGTEIVRETVKYSYWIDLARSRVKALEITEVVFTDARFENERDLIKELGGFTILIKRGNVDSEDSHKSETGLGSEDDYDMVITNDENKARLEYEFDVWYGYKLRSRT